jgi:hypothetical protein
MTATSWGASRRPFALVARVAFRVLSEHAATQAFVLGDRYRSTRRWLLRVVPGPHGEAACSGYHDPERRFLDHPSFEPAQRGGRFEDDREQDSYSRLWSGEFPTGAFLDDLFNKSLRALSARIQADVELRRSFGRIAPEQLTVTKAPPPRRAETKKLRS